MADEITIRVRDAVGNERLGNLSYSGQEESYRLTLTLPEMDGAWSAFGDDFFDSLCNLRLKLDDTDLRMCVNGARIDAYPSGLSRDMGGGQMLYVLRRSSRLRRALRLPGKRTRGLVDIFGPAPFESTGTVQEQRAFYDAWLNYAI